MICALIPLPAAALLATLLGTAGHVSPPWVQSQMNHAGELLADSLRQPVETVSRFVTPWLKGPSNSSSVAAAKSHFPWKTNIVATVFWVGEAPSGNNLTPNLESSWDQNWMATFGGYDDPDPLHRVRGFRPAAFIPRQNPFYVALPYNDCYDNKSTKAEAARVVPWFYQAFKKCGQSVCKDRWIAIRCGDRTCYAQWSDCGPFSTEDAKYVFGNTGPANRENGGAGIDLSPAVRDQLGFKSGAKCDWRFVDLDEVPDGPWRLYGANNPFAKDWHDESKFLASAERVSAAAPSAAKSKGSNSNGVVHGTVKRPGLVLRSVTR
jgi:hypothetical protein